MSAFENFAQGWFLVRNRWYDIPFFLSAWFTLFHPGGVAALFGVEPAYRYYFFFLGLLLYGMALLFQKLRKRAAR